MSVESFLKTQLSLHFLRQEKEQNEKAENKSTTLIPFNPKMASSNYSFHLEKGNIIETFLLCDKVWKQYKAVSRVLLRFPIIIPSHLVPTYLRRWNGLCCQQLQSSWHFYNSFSCLIFLHTKSISNHNHHNTQSYGQKGCTLEVKCSVSPNYQNYLTIQIVRTKQWYSVFIFVHFLNSNQYSKSQGQIV